MDWIQRLHVLIIGPGLGRNEVETVSSIIQNVNLPMIIDADGQGRNFIRHGYGRYNDFNISCASTSFTRN